MFSLLCVVRICYLATHTGAFSAAPLIPLTLISSLPCLSPSSSSLKPNSTHSHIFFMSVLFSILFTVHLEESESCRQINTTETMRRAWHNEPDSKTLQSLFSNTDQMAAHYPAHYSATETHRVVLSRTCQTPSSRSIKQPSCYMTRLNRTNHRLKEETCQTRSCQNRLYSAEQLHEGWVRVRVDHHHAAADLMLHASFHSHFFYQSPFNLTSTTLCQTAVTVVKWQLRVSCVTYPDANSIFYILTLCSLSSLFVYSFRPLTCHCSNTGGLSLYKSA